MTRTLTLRWHDFETPVRVTMLEDEAPELCKAILAALPLTSISWHSVISGDNIGFPLPVVWTKVDNPRVRTRGDAYLYANGQLGIIPYGKTTEPGDVNVWGRLNPEDFDALEHIGLTVAEQFRRGPGQPFLVTITAD